MKAPEDFSEAGFCAMLMNFRECRLMVKPEEIYTLLKNPTAQDTALSILTENTEKLFEFWLSTGNTEKYSLVKRGEEFCRQITGLNAREIWQKIYGELKTRSITRRINDIRAKLRTNSATPQELQELPELQRQKDLYAL